MEDIARVLLDWHVLLIAGCLLVVFPLVFYLSSLDRTPVRVRRIVIRERRTKRKETAAYKAAEAQPRLKAARRGLPRSRPGGIDGNAPGEGYKKRAPEERHEQAGNGGKKFEEPEGTL